MGVSRTERKGDIVRHSQLQGQFFGYSVLNMSCNRAAWFDSQYDAQGICHRAVLGSMLYHISDMASKGLGC